ncbi:MAG: isochorismatase [Geitlerinemataceae cyanobacterium]
MSRLLEVPEFFQPDRVGELWRVPYAERANDARQWAAEHDLPPAADDRVRVGLLAIDVQNTFCLPDFELFVAGRSGTGAIDDTVRFCRFLYQNLATITEIIPTLDTHTARQVFHPSFWRDSDGNAPAPMTIVTLDDVEAGRWQIDPSAKGVCPSAFSGDLDAYACHYVRQLTQDGKLPLTIWPYHGMLGGVGHALVSAFDEACFFHNLARQSQTRFEQKGSNPLTENYSVLRPEVMTDDRGTTIASKNTDAIEYLLSFDALIVAGQAKSHCVAWSVRDLLDEIQTRDPSLARRVYLLEDCMSPVVVPDVVDYTDAAEAVFADFAAAGMQRVTSEMAIETWANFPVG